MSVVEPISEKRSKRFVFDCSFLGEGIQYSFRAPMFGDELRARLWAAEWIANNERDSRLDNAMLSEVETVCLIQATLIDDKVSTDEMPLPAFATPQQLWDRCSTDQLAVLAANLNHARELRSPYKRTLTDEEGAVFARALADMSADDAAELLIDKDRDWLIRFAIFASGSLVDE